MARLTRTTTQEAVQKVNHLMDNPPKYEDNERVNLQWADSLGNIWNSNFVSFALALEFIEGFLGDNGEIVAMNAGWW